MFVLTESFELSQKKLSVPQRGLRYKRCAVGRVTPRLKHDDSFLYTRVPNIAKQFSNTCVAIPHHPTPATEIPPPPAPLPLPKGRGWKSPADCSCDGCGTKKTPVRRGESSGAATLCNACGLRIKKNAVAASRDKHSSLKPPPPDGKKGAPQVPVLCGLLLVVACISVKVNLECARRGRARRLLQTSRCI